MRAWSPTGSQIIGRLETVPCRTEIVADSFTKDEINGELQFDWEGGSEMFWDDSHPILNEKGHDLFLAEDGSEWTAADLIISDERPNV